MRAMTRPVRVCYAIDELANAGTETQLLALIRELDRSRVMPSLVLLRGESELSRALEPNCCPVLRLGLGRLRDPRAALGGWRFLRFLWEQKVDVVQTYFPDTTYFAVPMARLAGVRHVVRTRNNIGHWLKPLDKQLGRALNALTSATIANCRAAREALLRDERPALARVHVLENGVDLGRFAHVSSENRENRPHRCTGKTEDKKHHSSISLRHCGLSSVEDARTVVGVVANLRPVKGLDVLIEAARHLPDVVFRIAGEGEQRSALQKVIDSLGLSTRFTLCGAVHDIPAFLETLDVAVSCSRAEGMSNAILEYMAAGRPIVATSVGATPEVVRDGIDGLLVPPSDALALASAIRRCVEDKSLAFRLAQSARERIMGRYSRKAMVRRFEDFYTRLVHGRAMYHETTA